MNKSSNEEPNEQKRAEIERLNELITRSEDKMSNVKERSEILRAEAEKFRREREQAKPSWRSWWANLWKGSNSSKDQDEPPKPIS